MTWLTLIVSILVSALAVAAFCVTRVNGSRCKLFLLTILWTVRLLAENCHEATPSRYTRISALGRSKIILGAWMIMAIVITNAYKGGVNSSFFVQHQQETNWSTVREMKNFSFYAISGSSQCLEKLTPAAAEGNKDVKAAKEFSVLYMEIYAYIRGRYEMLGAPDLITDSRSDDEQYKFVISLLVGNTTYLCKNALPSYISNEMTRQKTAFLAFSEDVEEYFSIFKDETARSSNRMHFAHNKNHDDNFLSRLKVFAITGGRQEDQKPVSDRIKALMTSGIYNVWDKWERAHALAVAGRIGNEKSVSTKLPQPLTIVNPNVWVVFALLKGCLIIACVSFSVEVLMTSKSSRSSTRNYVTSFMYP